MKGNTLQEKREYWELRHHKSITVSRHCKADKITISQVKLTFLARRYYKLRYNLFIRQIMTLNGPDGGFIVECDYFDYTFRFPTIVYLDSEYNIIEEVEIKCDPRITFNYPDGFQLHKQKISSQKNVSML